MSGMDADQMRQDAPEVAAAHSRLLDLVLSGQYSGDSLQKAIRALIVAARADGEHAQRWVRQRAAEINDDGRALMEAANDWEMAARSDGFGFASRAERARIAAVNAREAFRRKVQDDCLPQLADVVLLARAAYYKGPTGPAR